MFPMLLNTESGFIVLQTGYGITIELARLGCVSFFPLQGSDTCGDC